MDVQVHATSASGAEETAQAIARETCQAKGFPVAQTTVIDLQRIYPPEEGASNETR